MHVAGQHVAKQVVVAGHPPPGIFFVRLGVHHNEAPLPELLPPGQVAFPGFGTPLVSHELLQTLLPRIQRLALVGVQDHPEMLLARRLVGLDAPSLEIGRSVLSGGLTHRGEAIPRQQPSPGQVLQWIPKLALDRLELLLLHRVVEQEGFVWNPVIEQDRVLRRFDRILA